MKRKLKERQKERKLSQKQHGGCLLAKINHAIGAMFVTVCFEPNTVWRSMNVLEVLDRMEVPQHLAQAHLRILHTKMDLLLVPMMDLVDPDLPMDHH